MRYPASEKLEIVRLVEQSPLPVCRTLTKLGIPRATFYRWYDRYSGGGPEALTDRSPRPDRVWNRIPDDVRQHIIQLAIQEPALSPRELAVRFTDSQSYFVSEASVYRLLKAHDLIASPAFIVIKAADAFQRQDHRTQPAVADRFHLSQGDRLGLVLPVHRARRLLPLYRRLEAVHDDESRGCHRYPRSGAAGLRFARSQAHATAAALVRQRVQLHRGRSRQVARRPQDQAPARRPLSSNDPGQDRALAPDSQKPHPAGKLLPARRPRNPNRGLRRRLQPPPLPREHRQSHPGRRLLRTRPNHPGRTRKDQATDHC